jgi:dTDP-glucose 4,6-dehydratase
MYPADLAIWLWTILMRGENCRAYNVGSEQAVSISELAHRVAEIAGVGAAVEVRGTPRIGERPERYVPSTLRARSELHLEERIDLSESIRRTLAFHRVMSLP